MDKLYIFAVLCYLPIAVPANKPPDHLIVTWQSFNCSTNRDIIASHRCIIVDPDKSLLTSEFLYARGFDHLNISIAVYVSRGKSKEFRKALFISGDGCRLNSKTIVNNIAKIVYKSVIKNSNYPKKCPIPKGLYYYRNVNLGENIPLFFPTGQFKAELKFFQDDLRILNIYLSGNLTRK